MVNTKKTVAQVVAELFGKSEKAISEKLSTDEYNVFSAEVQEVADRLDAQADGNEKLKADYQTSQAEVTRLSGELAAQVKAGAEVTSLKTENASLKTKADQWDAYQASLKSIHPDIEQGNKGQKGGAISLSEKEQAQLDEKKRLKAMYPDMMADIEVAAGDED